MIKRLFFILSGFMTFSAASFADIAQYDNDETYTQCSKLSDDWDSCTKEEMKRVMYDVKLYYTALLTDARLDNWFGAADKTKEVLKDMYDSWVAYRVRRCSLEKAANAYIPSLQDTEISCNTYFTMQQRDFLGNILYTLNYWDKSNKYRPSIASEAKRFEFLKIDEHDEGFDMCRNTPKKSLDACIADETKRTEEALKDLYTALLKEAPTTKKWNNGPDFTRGNFKDMFDSWVAYRNRLCSLATYVQQRTFKDKAKKHNECILYMDNLERIMFENLLSRAYGALDEESYPDDPEDEEGGEILGKSIQPLTNYIATTVDGENGGLSLTEDDEPAAQAESAQTTDDKGRALPDWAARK